MRLASISAIPRAWPSIRRVAPCARPRRGHVADPRVEPRADGSLDAATVSTVDLRSLGTRGARGLAFDASTGHLHLRRGQALHELTTAEVVATRDLSGVGLASPEGMVIAPSSDQTDAPDETSVYMADSGGRIVELSLAPSP